jgi:stress-induced morphogen
MYCSLKLKLVKGVGKAETKLGDFDMNADQLIEIIKETIPSAEIRATDLTGGGDHWRLKIVAEEFKGLSMVEQHQLVYRSLGNLMESTIHALSLDTSAPD